jgi:hypothetical protein
MRKCKEVLRVTCSFAACLLLLAAACCRSGGGGGSSCSDLEARRRAVIK